MKLIGFHGTAKDNIYSIIENGINQSKNGWFGTGAYFFLEDKELCLRWAKRKYYNKKCVALKVEINVEDEYVLDTRIEEDRKLFHEERIKLIKNHRENNTEFTTDTKEFDNIVCNYISVKYNIKLIIANSFTFDFPKEFNSRIPNGTELCVFDNSILKYI